MLSAPPDNHYHQPCGYWRCKSFSQRTLRTGLCRRNNGGEHNEQQPAEQGEDHTPQLDHHHRLYATGHAATSGQKRAAVSSARQSSRDEYTFSARPRAEGWCGGTRPHRVPEQRHNRGFPICGARGAAQVSEEVDRLMPSKGALRVESLPEGFRMRRLGKTMRTTKFECIRCGVLTRR